MHDLHQRYTSEICHSADRQVEAHKSIFGWIIRGVINKLGVSNQVLKVNVTGNKTEDMMRRFWKVEDIPDSHPQLTSEETRAVDHFR